MEGQKKRSSDKSRQYGFSIVAVLVASVILGLLAVAFSSLLMNTQKGQKSIQNSADFENLKNTIKMVISREELCEVAFRNAANSARAVFKNSNGPYPSPLQDVGLIRIGALPSATVVAKDNLKLGGGLSISKLALQQLHTRDASTPGKYVYITQLIVRAKKNTIGIGGNELSNQDSPIRVIIETNASNNRITKCRLAEEPGAGTQCQFCMKHNEEDGKVWRCSAWGKLNEGVELSTDIKDNSTCCGNRIYTKLRCKNSIYPLPEIHGKNVP